MSNWYAPSLLPEQLFQARLKAHDAIQEHLKQLITVSGATLALTVTFLKDVVGTPGNAQHRWMLFAGWLALIVCVAFAVIAIATLVNSLDRANPDKGNDGYPVAFAAGHLPLPRLLLLGAFGSFVAGLALLALFSWINFPNAPVKTEDDSKAASQPAPEWRHTRLGSFTDFESGDAELSRITRYDASTRVSEICASWKQHAADNSCPSLVIVGNADRRELRGEARRRYGSNAGLARARAEAVRDGLASCSASCGPADPNRALVLISGPTITPATGGTVQQMGADRGVDVWTLHHLPSQRRN